MKSCRETRTTSARITMHMPPSPSLVVDGVFHSILRVDKRRKNRHAKVKRDICTCQRLVNTCDHLNVFASQRPQALCSTSKFRSTSHRVSARKFSSSVCNADGRLVNKGVLIKTSHMTQTLVGHNGHTARTSSRSSSAALDVFLSVCVFDVPRNTPCRPFSDRVKREVFASFPSPSLPFVAQVTSFTNETTKRATARLNNYATSIIKTDAHLSPGGLQTKSATPRCTPPRTHPRTHARTQSLT